jgi:hypothetical protein
VSKPSQGIRPGDRANGLFDRRIKCFASPCPYTARHSLYPRPAFLYRRQVWRLRRQVDKLCPATFYRFSYPANLVCAWVVHHHNLSSSKRRAQHLADTSPNPGGRSSPGNRPSPAGPSVCRARGVGQSICRACVTLAAKQVTDRSSANAEQIGYLIPSIVAGFVRL